MVFLGYEKYRERKGRRKVVQQKIPIKHGSRRCVLAIFAALIILTICSIELQHHKLIAAFPNEINFESIISSPETSPAKRRLSIVTRVSCGLGNNFGYLSMARMIQSRAKQQGLDATFHIQMADGITVPLLEREKSVCINTAENRDGYIRALKRCFPNVRDLMFFEGNEEKFLNYSMKQNEILGPEIANQLLLDKYECRHKRPENICITACMDRALNAVRKVWDSGELEFESGQWNSTFKNGTVLGPYSFPMVTNHNVPNWSLLGGEYYDELMRFFTIDEECYEAHKVRAEPDEVVFNYRNFEALKSKQAWHDELSSNEIATNVLGHLKAGDKLAIVTARRRPARGLIQAMRARNVTVRAVISQGHDFMADFFFMLSARRELIGRAESTFFMWAALFNRRVQRTKAYSYDNGYGHFQRYFGDYPHSIKNTELKERVHFQLFNKTSSSGYAISSTLPKK